MRFRSRRLILDELEDRTVPDAGDIEWLRQVGSLGQLPAFGRAVDADGNVYIAGSASVLPGLLIGNGRSDLFVRKYDAAGTEVWTRMFGSEAGFSGPSDESVTAIDVYGSAVYLAGLTRGSLPGHVNAGGSDAFVSKFDTDGNALWTRQFGTTLSDQAHAIAADATGVYVGGETLGALPGQTSAGFRDAFVRKYDAAGTEVWTRQFGSTVSSSSADTVSGIAVDASGVFVAGSAQFALPGQTIAGAFLRKYDTSGAEVFTRQFGAGGANAVAVGDLGIFVAGGVTGALPGQTSTGGLDAYVRLYDAAGMELWTRQFGTTAGDQANAVAVDASGIYLVGNTAGTLPGQTSAGGQDVFVRKYSLAGAEQWTRQFGTRQPLNLNFTDEGYGIAVDATGVYVVGNAVGALPFQTTEGGGAFVRKYDAGGGDIWIRQLGRIFLSDDFARAVDQDGNVYVAGEIAGSITSGQTIAGDVDAFVSKYDAAGNVLWTRQFGALYRDAVNGVAADASGVYLVGLTRGTLPGQITPASTDAFVRKYDADGNLLWSHQFGSTTNVTDSANAVAVDASGVYVAGTAGGALPGQTSSGDADAFVRKYDFAGNELWTRQFGGTFRSGPIVPAPSDSATGIAVDATGVYLAGSTGGTFAGQTSPGGLDAFVRRYDAAGNAIWTRQFGTAAADLATGIATDASGLYLTGFTTGTLVGQTSAGGQDAFLRRMDVAGDELWTRQFGTPGTDQANGVATGSSGIYVAGSVGGTLPGETSSGGQDAFVRKFDAAGAVIWTGQFGTGAADSAAGITVGTAGLLVAGSTTGLFPGQSTFTGGQDLFVARIVDDVSNTPPSNVSLNLNASVNEAGTATLTGSFTDPDAGDTHTVVINWGSGEGTTTLNLAAGVTTFSTNHTYLDDAPAGTASDVYTVSATVSDASSSASGSTNLTVSNLRPMAGISGSSSGLSGDSLVFTLTANDPSPLDQETGFTFRIDWDNDGVVDEMVTGASGTTIAHTYSTPASYSVRVTAEDNDTGVSDAATIAVQILARPTVQGLVWVDVNNDGEVNFGETAISDVTITLTGIDDLGQSVDRIVQTDENGVYVFINLRPSNAAGYSIAENQPAGFPDGRDALGTVNGALVGSAAVIDVFSGVVLSQGGLSAENYNFGERPATNGGVHHGLTATIGYWQNKNGQNLIKSLNGGETSTQLGNWLAATFPNMYAALAGKTNAQVAAHYKTLFARTSDTAPGGPPKVDVQVMATAFAVYVTNQTLAGTTATAFGFQVSATGLGTRTFNVASGGAAFGVADNTSVSVMDLLLAANARAHDGLIYDLDGNGQISSSEASYRTMANVVFTAINEAGDI